MHVKTMNFTNIAMVMVLACAAVLADQQPEMDICSSRTDCTRCTSLVADAYEEDVGGTCLWSTIRQTCTGAISKNASLAEAHAHVYDSDDCPRFVLDSGRAVLGESFVYRVNVSNDATGGLVSYLSEVGFTCHSGYRRPVAGRVEHVHDDGGEIVCDPVAVTRKRLNGDDDEDDHEGQSMIVERFSIVFGPENTTLLMETDKDYYVSFYAHDCAKDDGDQDDDGYENGCVVCAWTRADFRYYVKRCSSRNHCVGLFEYYDRQPVRGSDRPMIAWTNGVLTECDSAVKVEWFEPSEVPWTTAELNVTVAVKNHRVLAEGATVNVTVAGRVCADPQAVPDEEHALSCTVAATTAVGNVEGPVRVVYTADRALTVESSDRFRFVKPTVDELIGPSCGPLAGGTSLTVVGTGFNVSNTVRVFVQLADGESVPCRVVKSDHEHVQCKTVAWPKPTGRGRVRVDFDASLSLFAPDRGFSYVDLPHPTDDQRLSGIASGGTCVHMRWAGLECLDHSGMSVVFHVYPHNTSRTCRAKELEQLECQTPYIDDLVKREDEDGGKTSSGSEQDSPVALLECDFAVWFDGKTIRHKCPDTGYAVYADPKFTDFELMMTGDGDKLMVYGHGELGLGFDQNDVRVMFRDKRTEPCVAVSVHRDRIECEIDPEVAVGLRSKRGDLRELLVSVGHAATVKVPARRREPGAPRTGNRTVFGFVAALVVLLAVIGYVAFLLRKKCSVHNDEVVQLTNLQIDGDGPKLFSAKSP